MLCLGMINENIISLWTAQVAHNVGWKLILLWSCNFMFLQYWLNYVFWKCCKLTLFHFLQFFAYVVIFIITPRLFLTILYLQCRLNMLQEMLLQSNKTNIRPILLGNPTKMTNTHHVKESMILFSCWLALLVLGFLVWWFLTLMCENFIWI